MVTDEKLFLFGNLFTVINPGLFLATVLFPLK